jgi:hypothetical protein
VRRAAAAVLAGLLGAAFPVAAGPFPVGPGDPPAPKWTDGIALRAFVSASFSHNFARPASATNQLRAFDTDDGSIRLDVASLVLEKPAEKPGEVGFRLDALAGALPGATAASGLFRDPATGEAEDFDLLQAYVRWVAPVGSGLTVDAGKFVSSFGLEPIEGPDGWGDHATHSFLFTLSEPTTHTGLKAGYAFSEVVSGELLLVNGWDDAKDRNGSKSLGAGLTVTPGQGVTLTATFMSGPETEGNDSDRRSLVGVAGELDRGGAVAGGVNVERGSEEGVGGGGAMVTWWGVAGYVRWAVTPVFTLSLRAERFRDADGARTGAAQTLHEVTVTPAVSLGSGLVLRADLRLDLSDEAVFEDSDAALARKRQATLLLNALYAF